MAPDVHKDRPLTVSEEQEQQARYIVENVILSAPQLAKYYEQYSCKTYLKGTAKLDKKGIFFRLFPGYFIADRRKKEAFVEAVIETEFVEPNFYNQQFVAFNSRGLDTDDISEKIMRFLKVNIYQETSFNQEVLMPIASNAFNYYRFFYEDCLDSVGLRIHKIRVQPKVSTQKLVSGYIYIADKDWYVAEIDFSGKWNFSAYNIKMKFGMAEHNFLLPIESHLELHTHLLGSRVLNNFTSYCQYSELKRKDQDLTNAPIKLDLSRHYNNKLEASSLYHDSLYWAQNRALELSDDDLNLLNSDTSPNNLEADPKQTSKADVFFLNIARGTIMPKRFSLGGHSMRYSGLINPLKFGYSGHNGLVYKQDLRISKLNAASGKELSFNPRLEYVFKRRELFVRMPLTWIYKPKKLGSFNISVGNKNSSFSSKGIDIINESLADSSFNFDSLQLNYYQHFYFSMRHRNELRNGLILDLGFDYHYYTPVVKAEPSPLHFKEINSDIEELITENYRSFTPLVSLTWTPFQYYRINNKRKEYLWSNFPTFNVEYARSVKGLLGSNSEYELVEIDVQQKIGLGLLRSVQYYAGMGMFTNTQSVYFADFAKFSRHNFPRSWNDGIGGVFQLLPNSWYNASNSYIQLHGMYESPLLLLQLFKPAANKVFSERFYFSQLYTPAIASYTEFGYGLGNFIFNIGIFAGFERGELQGTGFKFSFELGNN
ncbi:hypothetical protein AwDysgo_14450 [Bacteroidales bacterium]|nr:hypothetical protein AwDysgo_14450 [Bacteroidales bacterium]